ATRDTASKWSGCRLERESRRAWIKKGIDGWKAQTEKCSKTAWAFFSSRPRVLRAAKAESRSCFLGVPLPRLRIISNPSGIRLKSGSAQNPKRVLNSSHGMASHLVFGLQFDFR